MIFTAKNNKVALSLFVMATVLFFIFHDKKNSKRVKPLPATSLSKGEQLPTAVKTPQKLKPNVAINDRLPSEKNSAEPVKLKAQILLEILESNNDNDPRLDTELKTLNENEKSEFRKIYSLMQDENRAGKGTLVFLLGRNITSEKDLPFFSSVLNEPLCLSLENCQEEHLNEDSHGSPAGATLVYPQIMALQSIKKAVQLTNDPYLKQQLIETIKNGLSHDSQKVSQRSERLLRSWAQDN